MRPSESCLATVPVECQLYILTACYFPDNNFPANLFGIDLPSSLTHLGKSVKLRLDKCGEVQTRI